MQAAALTGMDSTRSQILLPERTGQEPLRQNKRKRGNQIELQSSKYTGGRCRGRQATESRVKPERKLRPSQAQEHRGT